MNKYKRKWEKRQKRADRRRRSLSRRTKKLKERLGVGDLYFFLGYDDTFYCSPEMRNAQEITNPTEFRNCITDNTLRLTYLRGGDKERVYDNFTELLRERLIIKLAGLRREINEHTVS